MTLDETSATKEALVAKANEEVLLQAAKAKEAEDKVLLQAVDELLDEKEDQSHINNGNKEKHQQLKKRHNTLRRLLREKLRERLVQPVSQKVVQPVTQASVRATRRIVTGNTNLRVRDFVVLPKVVRVLDKYTFTGGVMGMLLTEFVLLQYPEWFGYYNIIFMLPLQALRIVLFHRTKQQYFLLDYCYWVNGLGMFLYLLPSSSLLRQRLFQIFFMSANGPLFFAMVAWNNSLVFHSVDKVTSVYTHLFPALTSWCERWYNNAAAYDDTLSWSEKLGWPLVFYLAWQTTYLLQTEWWHKPQLDADPDLSTSLRYLTTAEKMPINRECLKLCRRLQIMGPDETFTPPTLKVKFIFVFLQMVMTIGTFLPVGWFLWNSKLRHSLTILAILLFSVYNGARYYIQVFSKIYDKRYYDNDQGEEEYVDTSAVMAEHVANHKQDKKSK